MLHALILGRIKKDKMSAKTIKLVAGFASKLRVIYNSILIYKRMNLEKPIYMALPF